MQARKHIFSILVLLTALTLPLAARADVKLPSIISNGMVLQRDQRIPLWGWDESGTEVTVSLDGATAKAKAAADGKWMVELPARKAGGPYSLEISGSSSVTLEDVLVGEVWLCSGQSNMEWSVSRSANAKQEIASAKWAKIRHIKVPHIPADKPQTDVKTSGWKTATPDNVASFTAVGYYFGRHLHQELDVPIGLIGSNWGGTRIEPWTPPVGFQKTPALKEITDKLGEYPTKRPNGSVVHQSPLALYNGMIHPLVPYGIRGALWYQGESNNGEGMLYHEKMKALIAGWREIWKNDKLPFYFVQLAPFNYGRNRQNALPFIWEAQAATLSVPHTGMAVTVDIGNVRDIHPRNKQDVGKRLALWALAKDYGKDVVYSGPIYKSVKFEGATARISFDHVAGGLLARDGKELTHFEVAGEDKKFVAAKATIDGETVTVSADGVTKPVAVRFAFRQDAEPNLSNKAGLPASPFRTDSW